MKRRTILYLILIGLSLAFNLVCIVTMLTAKTQSDLVTSYPLLSPRIFAERQNDILINFLPLRKTLKELTAPWGDTFTVYFEYLPTGSSIGINEKMEFKSASLVKLPIAMAYFNQLENAPLVAGNKTVVIEDKYIDMSFGTLWQGGAGRKISLEEAMSLSLVESDNTATRVLADNVGEEFLENVYNGLDIDITYKENETVITTKQYASILKALYFSSVISHEHSQKILSLLAATKFHNMLPAGVDPNITVAHKIGIHKENSFRDCGIIYVPKRPYIVCAMSNSDEETAVQRIRDVSQAAFKFVSSYNASP